jgi:hypothetical protein
VPQPTTLPRAPETSLYISELLTSSDGRCGVAR